MPKHSNLGPYGVQFYSNKHTFTLQKFLDNKYKFLKLIWAVFYYHLYVPGNQVSILKTFINMEVDKEN